jgi:hypothetical protein
MPIFFMAVQTSALPWAAGQPICPHLLNHRPKSHLKNYKRITYLKYKKLPQKAEAFRYIIIKWLSSNYGVLTKRKP